MALEDIKTCCTDHEPFGEGTSLLSRIIPMLDPANAPIDPGSVQDILVFAQRYAELVRFYDLNDKIDCVQYEDADEIKLLLKERPRSPKFLTQDQKQIAETTVINITTWKDFFSKDIAVLIAVISQYGKQLSEIKNEYNVLRKKVTEDTDHKKQLKNYRSVFLKIIEHFKRIQGWYEQSVNGHPLQKELEIKIGSFLARALEDLISYDRGFKAVFQENLDLITEYENFTITPWNKKYDDVPYNASIYQGDNDSEKIIYALLYVDDVFNTTIKVYEEIMQRNGYYWQQAIEAYPTHQPHMALFIAFVELFAYAKKELNELTTKHLDFFYRDVLHLKEKPASADSVYLIYQLAKGVDDFELKKEAELSAGKDGLGKQMIFKTDADLVINKAKVKELKTVFLDIGSPINNVYAAPVANSADGKGEKFKDTESTWSTFGYFEPQDDPDKLVGQEAALGFAIASPHFQLAKSDRTISIRIYYQNREVKAGEETKEEKDIPVTLTEKDFEIYFTGEKDWIQPINETEKDEFNGKKIPGVFLNRATAYLKATDAQRLADIFGLSLTDANKLIKEKDKDDYLNAILETGLIPGEKLNAFIESFANKIVTTGSTEKKELFLDFKLRIQTQQGAITMPGKDFKEFNLATSYPVCKIIFDPGNKLYDKLKDVIISKIETSVEVTGLMDVIVENDNGVIDPQKPFYPFTPNPSLHSSIFFGAKEFENKRIDNLFANVEWMGELEFPLRYLGYVNFLRRHFTIGDSSGIDLITNSAKKNIPADNLRMHYENYIGKPSVFSKGKWVEQDGDVKLFDNDADAVRTISWGLIKKGNTGVQALESNNWKIASLTLNKIDFGHKLYPTLVSQYLAKRKGIKVEGGEIVIYDLPEGSNDVFIPSTPAEAQIKSVSVNYTSTSLLDPDKAQFFHIYPFGEVEIYFDAFDTDTGQKNLLKSEKNSDQLIVATNYLLPQFKFGHDDKASNELKTLNEVLLKNTKEFGKNYLRINQYFSLYDQQGNLYIGIEDLVTPQNLSLLFKFADGSAYDNDSPPPAINWSYLVNNEWLPLPASHLVTDSTYGFQTTGIVLIDFPADATNNNTMFTKGLHWLCASIEKNGRTIPRLINVIAQANQATFTDNQNDPAHYQNPLPAKTISKPLVKIPEIKLIDQPFESFDGKPGEVGKQFYRRVSERLRHKGRAITAKDYELLVLEQFPSVYKVKILSHNDPGCLCRHMHDPAEENDCCCAQMAPGHVLIIPISNLRNRNAIDLLKPRTGRRTLIKIEEFLKKRVSPFVHIYARNPKFEEVKVAFNVKFHTGVDKGYHLRELNKAIVRHLTPWAFDSSFEVLFGNKIYASKIIDFIEGLDYVDYITCFRMIQIVEGCCVDDSLEDIDCDKMKIDLAHLKKELAIEVKKTEKLSNTIEELIKKSSKSVEQSQAEEELRIASSRISELSEKVSIEKRFLSAVSASSAQAILVSAKQHCITVIDDEIVEEDCNCKDGRKKPIEEKADKEIFTEKILSERETTAKSTVKKAAKKKS